MWFWPPPPTPPKLSYENIPNAENKFSEASLLGPDFTIFAYSRSSCNYLFFGLILAPLFSSIKWHPTGNMGCQKKVDKESETERLWQKRENYVNCQTQKSGTIRLL